MLAIFIEFGNLPAEKLMLLISLNDLARIAHYFC